MIGALILAAAMTGQGQRPAPDMAPAPSAGVAGREAAQLAARRRAKKSARYRARLDDEAREAAAARAQAEAEYREWKSLLPYALENQRQMLQRQTDRERNAVLDRMAGAMERRAGYVYPGQSPTVGPYR